MAISAINDTLQYDKTGNGLPVRADVVVAVGPNGNPIGNSPVSGAPTDRSGAITTGNTAQQAVAANAARRRLTGQNISAGDLWINVTGGTAAVDTSGSYKVVSNANSDIYSTLAISIVGATTGQKYTLTEW